MSVTSDRGATALNQQGSIRAAGGEYFNPDEAAGRLVAPNPGADLADANIAGWTTGRRQLERAIAERRNYAFETMLRERTITRLLQAGDTARAGHASRTSTLTSHCRRHRGEAAPLQSMPIWAKPIAMAALGGQRRTPPP